MRSKLKEALVSGVLLLSAVLALPPPPARGECLGSLGVKVGAFMPNSDEKGLKDFNTGYVGAAEARVSLFPMFNLNPQVAYLQTGRSQSGVTVTLTDIPIELNLLFTAPIPVLDLYAGVGASYHIVAVKVEGSGGSQDNGGTGLGYQGKVGVGYSLAVGTLFLEGEDSASQVKFDKNTGSMNSNDTFNTGGITVFLGYKIGL